MPTCPVCGSPLETRRQREGLAYPCNVCLGRAMTLSQVRQVFGESLATKLLRLIKLGRHGGTRRCPFCAQLMLRIQTEQPPLVLEACRSCSVIWLDDPTYESLPQLTCETLNSRAMQATEIIALQRLQDLKKRMEQERREVRKKRKKNQKKSEPEGSRDSL